MTALEQQVNYFVVQLAVARKPDWERFRRDGFRRSWLADDLSRR